MAPLGHFVYDAINSFSNPYDKKVSATRLAYLHIIYPSFLLTRPIKSINFYDAIIIMPIVSVYMYVAQNPI